MFEKRGSTTPNSLPKLYPISLSIYKSLAQKSVTNRLNIEYLKSIKDNSINSTKKILLSNRYYINVLHTPFHPWY